MEVGMPSALPMSRSTSVGGATDTGSEYSSSGPEKFSRTGSTSVMSVSEFYGPNGARMLQRRGSAVSQMSLADSYGEGEPVESVAAGREETREGQAALSMLVADGLETGRSSPPPLQDSGVGGGTGGVDAEPKQAQPSPPPVPVIAPAVLPSVLAPKMGTVAEEAGSGGTESCPTLSRTGQEPATNSPTALLGSTVPSGNGGSLVEQGRVSAPQAKGAEAPQEMPVAPTPAAAKAGSTATEGRVEMPKKENEESGPSVPPPIQTGVSETTTGLAVGLESDPSALPPLNLEEPHPCATSSVSKSSHTQHKQQQLRQGRSGIASPASSLTLPWVGGVGTPTGGATRDSAPHDRNQRIGMLRAMSVDSAPSPARPLHARTLSVPDTESFGGGVTAGAEAFGISVGGGLRGAAQAAGGGSLHSPRLRAKSMDSGGRKGKSKRGKGPNAAVMGKADRIGRMLQVYTSVCSFWGEGGAGVICAFWLRVRHSYVVCSDLLSL